MMKTRQSVVNAIRSITAASLLLLLLVDIPEADAVVVKGLYDVEYPVPDQSRTVRTAVFNKGLEEVLIDVLRERMQTLGIGNVQCEVMNGESLEVPDSSYDAAACSFGLMFSGSSSLARKARCIECSASPASKASMAAA